MSRFRNETDLAKLVRRWLVAQGWDVYPEVQVVTGGARADLVGMQDGLLWAVECKLTFGLGVIAQATEWLHYAHYVSVAVPTGGHNNARRLGKSICHQYGIGVIQVPNYSSLELPTGFHSAWKHQPPRVNRAAHRNAKYIRERLSPRHKDFTPGNADSQFWTPFRGTCEAVRDFLTRNGSATLRELVDGIEHHYHNDKSARATLRMWIGKGIVPGVGLDKTKRPYRVVLEDK